MNSTTRVSSIGGSAVRVRSSAQSRPASPKGDIERYEIKKNNLIKKIRDTKQAEADDYNLIRCKLSGKPAADPYVPPADDEFFVCRREFYLECVAKNGLSPITREPMQLIFKKDEPYIRYKGTDFYAGADYQLYTIIRDYVQSEPRLQKEVILLYTLEDYYTRSQDLTDDVSTARFYDGRKLTRKECLLEAIDIAQQDKFGVYDRDKKSLPFFKLAQLLDSEESITLKNGEVTTQLSLLLMACNFAPHDKEITDYMDSVLH